MKKNKLFIFILLTCFMQLTACVSSSKPQPRPLDISDITEDIPIHTVSLLIQKNLDIDNMGERYFNMLFIENINEIHTLLAAQGLNFDLQRFLNEFNESHEIKFEEMKYSSSFILHDYFWQSENRADLRMNIVISAVFMSDGSMPMSVTVRKDDPDYEPGYRYNNVFGLHFNN